MSKIIHVSGNVGKTTLSYFLAKKLAADSLRVMIVSTNMAAPDIECLLSAEKKSSKSLGRVLNLAVIDTKGILDNVRPFKNDNIRILCYQNGESRNSYPQIQQSSIQAMFEILKGLVDYIIVDAQTDKNEIDLFAEEIADVKLCITSADMKGLAYRIGKEEESHTHILMETSKYNPYEDIFNSFKNHVKYQLPYCESLQTIYNGCMLDEVSCPRKYEKVLNALVLAIGSKEESDE